MELSVVIPCYNEEESILELYKRVSAACQAAPIKSYEIILINDGSKDNTYPLMKELVEKDSHIVAINLSRNHGQQMALTAGLHEAKGEYIFILDADLQDPPELLTPMLERARTGVDVVYGQRASRQGETWLKLFTARLFYRTLSYLSDTSIPENVADFRLISRRVLDQYLSMPEQQRFFRGMISWVGYKQEPFLFERDARFAGVTKYSFFKLIAYAIDAISSFSTKPLRIAIPFAIFGAILAGFLGLFAIYSYFTGAGITGWTSLACIMTFFASLQLLCIALIGEYIGRIYMEVKRRPLFVVDETLRSSASSKTQASPSQTAGKAKKSTDANTKKPASKKVGQKKEKVNG